MARVSYDILPIEGAKFDRDVSRVANQAMQGNQNIVLDISIPAGGFDTGTFRVNDPRISAQKWVEFMPLDINSLFITDDIFISQFGNGFFDLSIFPQELQRAYMQVTAFDAVGPSLIADAKIPFDNVSLAVNFSVDNVNDEVTVLTAGVIDIGFTLSGAYAVGTDFTFGVRVIGGPNAGNDFTVQTSTSNQNDVVSVAGSILAGLDDGDVLIFFGGASSSANLDPYDLVWSMQTLAGSAPVAPGAGPFEIRALIIG